MFFALRIDQLDVDTDILIVARHRPFDHLVDTEPLADLGNR